MLGLPALLVPLVLAMGTAAAGDPSEAPEDPALRRAEHQRLSGEMEQLARRQIWVGLEDKFRKLVALGVEPSFEDWTHGAYAARALGDAMAARDRLEAACALQEDEELLGWLRSIDSQYGRVVLTTAPPRSTDLVPAALPFAPDKRAAVEFAVQRVAEGGVFEGLLPAGGYRLADTDFSVEPGIELRIEVSSRRQRSTRKTADGD